MVPPGPRSSARDDEITVGGPLTLDPEQHELPITIQVMVAQTPKAKPGEPDEERFKPKNAKIARGVVVIDKGDIVVGAPETKWSKTLKAPTGDFRDGGGARDCGRGRPEPHGVRLRDAHVVCRSR